MAAATHLTVVGVFQSRLDADEAIDELRVAGFTPSQIGVVTRDEQASRLPANVDEDIANRPKDWDRSESNVEEGAAMGAVAGAGIGGLIGLGIISNLIPGIGPAIFAGTMGAVLSNALGGAAVAGLAGALIGMGVPEHEARFYENEINSGRTVVTVDPDGRVDEARAILRSHGAFEAGSTPNL